MTDDAHIHTALKAGAAGYIPKDTSREHILAAIRRLAVRPAEPGYPTPE